MKPSQVTACLVTRGDQPNMVRRIAASLIFDNVVVWDNSVDPDHKTYGRYRAMSYASTEVVYFQDDDVIVPEDTQRALLAAYEPGVPTCVYGHGHDDGGYGDVPLVGAGALVEPLVARLAACRYLARYSFDDAFAYYCDFAIGVLYPEFVELDLPFHIELPVAQHPSRLCNQPWAADMKKLVTDRARRIRDGEQVAA